MAGNKVAMPMSSAGIIGSSPDIKIAGKSVDPKIIVGAIILLVVVVQIGRHLF